LAVAAIAASLFLGRHREVSGTQDADNETPATRELDAIRAAGL
jgi:hypothetical protein